MQQQRLPIVNIAIVTWNRRRLTQRCIRSLRTHTRYPCRVLVADNGSTDGTRDDLRAWHDDGVIDTLVLFDRNVGVAPAANSLWELCDGWYLKLDNDVEIRAHGWLQAMMAVALHNTQVGLLGYSFQQQLYGRTFPLETLVSGHRVQRPGSGLNGACILVPPQTRLRAGFWCEDYAPYGEEDADYSFRCRLLGLQGCYMAATDQLVHLREPSSDTHDAGAYRQYKDRRRRCNTDRFGPATVNRLLYCLGQRSLYMRRKFRTRIDPRTGAARLELDTAYRATESRQLASFVRYLRAGGYDHIAACRPAPVRE